MTIDPAAQLRHDLRTPLNHIIGYSEMLLEEVADGDTPALAGDLRALHTEARQLLGLLNEVLGSSRGEPPADLSAAHCVLVPSLDRVRALARAVREAAAHSDVATVMSDVDRICTATDRLAALVVRGGAGRVQAPASAPVGAADREPSAVLRPIVLVVDDNEGNRDMLTRRLARQGYEVRTAAGGRVALEALAREPVDLVLLDVMMPDLDGYQVLERMKADPGLRHVPVLMISALDELDSVVRCIQLGAEDYLSKPFDPVLLQARLGACLEKKRLYDQERRHLEQLDEWNRTLERRVAEQLALVERLGRLKRFFSPQLADLIVAGGTEDPLKPHRREVTVVFLDLRGFTTFTETAEPEELMAVLREYHAEMGRLILEHEGTLERFTGDGMMVFFNDPMEVPNPAERAVRMAIAMRDRVAQLAGGWRKRGWDLGLGIGIAQGYATIGAIGFEGRWDYAAIGTVSNLAARLCSEAKVGQVLVSSRVAAAVEGLVEAEEVGALHLKGLARPVPTLSLGRLTA